MHINPYRARNSRKEQVKKMFNTIAHRYDFLNHLLSFNIDKKWRRRLSRIVNSDITGRHKDNIRIRLLDVATGTGDLAIELSKNKNISVSGLDISSEMLKRAEEKARMKKMEIDFIIGDSEDMAIEDNSYDYVTVAFGVRNFEDLQKGLKEIYRVLKTNGKLFILEFSKPENHIYARLYSIYSLKILPKLAALFGGDKNAYLYLPDSITAFPYGRKMLEEMDKAGFCNTRFQVLSGGISTIYEGSVLKN